MPPLIRLLLKWHLHYILHIIKTYSFGSTFFSNLAPFYLFLFLYTYICLCINIYLLIKQIHYHQIFYIMRKAWKSKIYIYIYQPNNDSNKAKEQKQQQQLEYPHLYTFFPLLIQIDSISIFQSLMINSFLRIFCRIFQN